MPRFAVEKRERLLDVLKARFPEWKASTLKQRLKNGLVRLNGEPVVSGAAFAEAGDEVEVLARPAGTGAVFPTRLGEPPLPILYADDSLLAVDKPSGLLSVASERERNETAVRLMREWLAELDPEAAGDLHAAHRLDRDASGVLLFARTLALKRKLAATWSSFEKIYLAVVDGVPPEKDGTIDAPLWEDKGLFVRVASRGGGQEALTRYHLVRTAARRSLLEVELETGRKHQIRVHLASIGCPIVGDQRYGVSKAKRLALHAHRLTLLHPQSGETVVITAPTPDFFKRALAKGRGERG